MSRRKRYARVLLGALKNASGPATRLLGWRESDRYALLLPLGQRQWDSEDQFDQHQIAALGYHEQLDRQHHCVELLHDVNDDLIALIDAGCQNTDQVNALRPNTG